MNVRPSVNIEHGEETVVEITGKAFGKKVSKIVSRS